MPAKQLSEPIDGRQAFAVSHLEYVRGRVQTAAAQIGMYVPDPPVPGVMAAEELPPRDLPIRPVPAMIHTNRWLAICDGPECGETSADYIWLESLWFMCKLCFNRSCGGYWRPVKLPQEAEAIVRVLNPRPPADRHWLPYESVDDLIAQNRANKVAI